MLSCEQSELTFQTGLIYFVSLNWLQKVNILQASLACEHAGFLNLIAVNWNIRNFQNVVQSLHQLSHSKLPNLKLCTKLLHFIEMSA